MFLGMFQMAFAQEEMSLFTQDFPLQEFQDRRSKIMSTLGTDAIALVKGAPSPRGFVRFRQSNEFYYLTGIEVPSAIVMLDGTSKSVNLYLPHRNERREAGEGKGLSAEDADWIIQHLGFSGVYGTDLLAEHLGRLGQRYPSKTIYMPFAPAEGMAESRDMGFRTNADIASDPWDGRPSAEGRFMQLVRERFPMFEIKDLSPTLDDMRAIKSPNEMNMIRKATQLSGLALMEGMRSTEPNMREGELDAVAKFIYFREGAQGDAYYSLVASGHNAFFPHYNAGKRIMQDGDFLLFDYAPDYGYYMSDVTRMLPVNGKFNAWQRELYTFYLGCYKAILNNIKPNETAQQIRARAVTEMEQLLAKSTFSKPEYKTAAGNFVLRYRAGSFSANTTLGHGVGMATHDVGTYNGVLKPGMVFTIEPALTVPEEQIYIRLEDLMIIHEDHVEIVSDFVPMDIDGIERLMAEKGILQTYTHTTKELVNKKK